MGSGSTHVYRCDRCPLILELGDFASWDSDGTILLEMIQVACSACGTMHRLTEKNGTCSVTALPGPVRATRTVVLRDISGVEFETLEWASKADWLPGGQHPGGIKALRDLGCNHCGQVGRMVTLEELRYRGGPPVWPPRREDCPVCGRPLEGFAVTDSI